MGHVRCVLESDTDSYRPDQMRCRWGYGWHYRVSFPAGSRHLVTSPGLGQIGGGLNRLYSCPSLVLASQDCPVSLPGLGRNWIDSGEEKAEGNERETQIDQTLLSGMKARLCPCLFAGKKNLFHLIKRKYRHRHVFQSLFVDNTFTHSLEAQAGWAALLYLHLHMYSVHTR